MRIQRYLICIIPSVKRKRKYAWINDNISSLTEFSFHFVFSLCVSLVSLSLSFQICNINSTAAPQFMFTVTVCTHTFTDSDGCVFMCIWRCVCFLDLLLIVCVIHKHMFLLFKHLSVYGWKHVLCLCTHWQSRCSSSAKGDELSGISHTWSCHQYCFIGSFSPHLSFLC